MFGGVLIKAAATNLCASTGFLLLIQPSYLLPIEPMEQRFTGGEVTLTKTSRGLEPCTRTTMY